jgi:hypothetical protein
MRYLCLFLLLLPLGCLAQFKIQGEVVNATDNKPVPDASISINNTTIGTKGAADGSFTLSNLSPGQYELIISVVGYEYYRKAIMMNENIQLGNIILMPKTMLMNEVVIGGSDPTRARKIRLFKEQFLGWSSFANQCAILNPGVLVLALSNRSDVLTGHSNDFLEIDNNALGYKLKYFVSNFVLNRLTRNVGYEGDVLFEEKPGTPQQKTKWEKNRRKAYFGSPAHFLRQILADRVDVDYMVRSFCIKKIDNGKLIYDTLAPVSYISKTDRRGVFALNYPTGIDVFYYPAGVAHKIHYFNGVEAGNRGQVANIQFIDQYLYFDSRGTILNPTGAAFNYEWSQSRVAELLPTDYWPLN